MTNSPPPGDSTLTAIESLFNNLPDDYSQAETRLKAISRTFHEVMARTLEPRLNDYLQQQNPGTLDEFHQNAVYVDALTKELGLNTSVNGKAALLVGEPSYRDIPSVARYALLVPDGPTRTRRTAASRDAPTLHLVPTTPDNDDVLARLRLQAEPQRRR